jgi:hypothetical protein
MNGLIPKTITVILKGDDKTYREKFLIYDELVMNPNDAFIKECIDTAKKNFVDPIEEIQVKASMVIV